MKKILKAIGYFFFGLLALVLLVFIGSVIFINTSPQFGADPVEERLARISSSIHFKEGKFVNEVPTKAGEDGDIRKILSDFLTAEHTVPEKALPTKYREGTYQKKDSAAYLTWFGHSAFLLEIEGMNILLDPMLGDYAAPVFFFGQRFPFKKAIDFTLIPDRIDAVVYSHDHYDHLDYPTVERIKDKVEHFYMPLGMGAHFESWGIEPERITELDWWESANSGPLNLIATPARHFSGRGLSNRDKTFWASWVIEGKYQKLFFSGDGGYSKGFKEIGEKYGPFDFTMMECGQYNPQWAQIHMMPEETVQAHLDLKGEIMMPIHWGAFNLAPHAWKDPIERAEKKAEELGVKMFTPIVGERFAISKDMQSENWWSELE
ncbi:MAG: MBL fold metallo-hydrolase [Bacteroidota bacterium]